MKTLTVTRPLGTANRWRVFVADPVESMGMMRVVAQLLNNGDALVSQAEVWVRNGSSDRVDLDTAPLDLSRALVVAKEAVATPTGYTDAFNAWKVGNTMAQRRDALETWMLSATVAGPNLAGT